MKPIASTTRFAWPKTGVDSQSAAALDVIDVNHLGAFEHTGQDTVADLGGQSLDERVRDVAEVVRFEDVLGHPHELHPRSVVAGRAVLDDQPGALE